MEDIDVGYIIEVNGIKIIGKMYENSNDLTFFIKVSYISPHPWDNLLVLEEGNIF